MIQVLKMAWRNVWRNWRRSGITIAAMTLALTVELLYSGLVTGLVGGMEEDATEFDLGDVQVLPDGYRTRPSLYSVVEDHDAIIGKLREAGYSAAPRLYSGGLAASGDLSAGVAFVGLDPVADTTTLALDEAIAEGAWLDGADPTGVVVGGGLARTLGLDLGSEIVVLSQASDGSIANALYTVRGKLLSVAASMDRTAILMPEASFRELMAFPDGAHKIVVRRPEGVSLEEAKVAVAGMAGEGTENAPIDVMTWKEINPFLAMYLQQVDGVVVVVYFIVYLAVAILILNAMLMAVFERIKEFGVLKAIGYSPGQVFTMMAVEGLLQAVVATVCGLVLAAPLMWYLSVHGVNVGVLGGVNMAGLTMPPVWHGDYSLDSAMVPVVMLFVIVLVAVTWPAAKAAWIRPVEAMTHQ